MPELTQTGIKTVDINGVHLAYREIGSGPPLVLINGFASTMDTWNPPLLAALARDFRVIIFDNRGTGYSSASEEPFSISLFADDTIALMNHRGFDHAHILGLSMGASIAQELVLAHPQRVERLVLVSGTCGGRQGIRIPPEVWNDLSNKSGSIAEITQRMFSVLFPQRWLADHDPMRYCPEVHETTSEGNAARQADAFFGWSGSWERLQSVRIPVLVITGSDDAIILPENSQILAQRIPGASVRMFYGAGHGLQYQHPQELARVVSEFLLG